MGSTQISLMCESALNSTSEFAKKLAKIKDFG